MKVTAFLPCRKGSERVPKKNIRPFAGFQHGLIEIKLKQLLLSKEIDEITLSSNDEEILDFAYSIKDSRLQIHRRADILSSSTTSTDALIEHAVELIPDGHILWTHVTSPFLQADSYDAIVQRYKEALIEGYDSLMTTSAIRGFLWDMNAPINYDRTIEKWPRTQTLDVVNEVNSAVFLNSAENYRKMEDRVGAKPCLYELNKIIGYDIDWEDDFTIAQCIVNSGIVKI